ncbi:MAG: two-component regulator propeller domain-containing protein [candidate division WOR-3 bacterium]
MKIISKLLCIVLFQSISYAQPSTYILLSERDTIRFISSTHSVYNLDTKNFFKLNAPVASNSDCNTCDHTEIFNFSQLNNQAKNWMNLTTIDDIMSSHIQDNKYLWLGSQGGGVVRVDIETGECLYLNKADGLADNWVNDITSYQNEVWFSTFKGISKWDGNRFTNYLDTCKIIWGPHGTITYTYAISASKNGVIFFSTEEDIYKYSKGEIKKILPNVGFYSNGIPVKVKKIIALNDTSFIYLISNKLIKWTNSKIDTLKTNNHEIKDFVVDNNGHVYFINYFFSSNSRTLFKLKDTTLFVYDSTNSPINEDLLLIQTDNRGKIILVSGSRNNDKEWYKPAHIYILDDTNWVKLKAPRLSRVLQIDSLGNLYFPVITGWVEPLDGEPHANWFNYVFKYNLYTKDSLIFPIYRKENSVTDNNIAVFYHDENDRLWIAPLFGGLVMIDKFGWHNYHTTFNGGPVNNNIVSIKEDKNGNVWFGSMAFSVSGSTWGGYFAGGVAKYDGKNWYKFSKHRFNNFPYNTVNEIYVDRFNNIWCKDYQKPGIVRINGNAWQSYFDNDTVFVITAKRRFQPEYEGYLFFKVQNELYFFESNSFIKLNIPDYIDDKKNIKAAVTHCSDTVWLITDKHLIKFNPKSKTFSLCYTFVSALTNIFLDSKENIVVFDNAFRCYIFNPLNLTVNVKQYNLKGYSSIFCDLNDNIWVFGSRCGIHSISLRDNVVKYYTFNNSGIAGGSYRIFEFYYFDKRNNKYFTFNEWEGWGKGVSIFNENGIVFPGKAYIHPNLNIDEIDFHNIVKGNVSDTFSLKFLNVAKNNNSWSFNSSNNKRIKLLFDNSLINSNEITFHVFIKTSDEDLDGEYIDTLFIHLQDAENSPFKILLKYNIIDTTKPVLGVGFFTNPLFFDEVSFIFFSHNRLLKDSISFSIIEDSLIKYLDIIIINNTNERGYYTKSYKIVKSGPIKIRIYALPKYGITACDTIINFSIQLLNPSINRITFNDNINLSLNFPNGIINEDLYMIFYNGINKTSGLLDSSLYSNKKIVFTIAPMSYKFTKPIEMEIIYNSTLKSLFSNPDELVILNLVENKWVALPTIFDKNKNTFLVYTNSLGIFSLVNKKELENDTALIKIIPKSYQLYQNFPNPFNNRTMIMLDIPEQCYIDLVVYDVLGRKIKKLISNQKLEGQIRVYWDCKDDNGELVSSGIYLCKLVTNKYIKTIKMIYLK